MRYVRTHEKENGSMSEHAELSPSAAERWINCTASVKYCHGVQEEVSVYADEGTYAHSCLELWLTLGVPPVDGEMYYNLLPLYEFALDLERRGYEVSYEVRAVSSDRFWGTIDIRAIKGRKLKIVDLKYGYTPVYVMRNPQILSYVKCTEDELGIEFTDIEGIIFQPRLPHIDGPMRSYTVTRSDLEWFAGELRVAFEEIDGPDAKFMTGKGCRYCPKLGDCRTAVNYVAKLLTGGPLL